MGVVSSNIFQNKDGTSPHQTPIGFGSHVHAMKLRNPISSQIYSGTSHDRSFRRHGSGVDFVARGVDDHR